MGNSDKERKRVGEVDESVKNLMGRDSEWEIGEKDFDREKKRERDLK